MRKWTEMRMHRMAWMAALLWCLLLTGCGAAGTGGNRDLMRETSMQEDTGQLPAEPETSTSDGSTLDDSTPEISTQELTTATSDYTSYANKKYAWWFMRNQEHQQPGCQKDFEIAAYDAYYVAPDSESKVIYLTFDCGYENGYTPAILDALKQAEVPAAFFVTQTFIRDNVELVKRMKQEGHLVCNHTVHHPSLPDLSVEEVKAELLTCQEYMEEQTGYSMDYYIRPPMGEYSERTLQACKDLGYKTIFWSIAYLDYDTSNQPGAGYVVEQFRKNHHPGAIPLIHNVSESNAQALPDVIALLKQEGYAFASLDALVK